MRANQVLPALPKAWSKGSVSGIRARGDVSVAMNWMPAARRELTLDTGCCGTHCRAGRNVRRRISDRRASQGRGRGAHACRKAGGHYTFTRTAACAAVTPDLAPWMDGGLEGVSRRHPASHMSRQILTLSRRKSQLPAAAVALAVVLLIACVGTMAYVADPRKLLRPVICAHEPICHSVDGRRPRSVSRHGRTLYETEMMPHDARWREQHHVDRETRLKAGETGLLLLDVPAEYGGGGGDFRHEAVMYTELARRGIGATARACTACARITCSITVPRSKSIAGCRDSPVANSSAPSA
jgi:hypothetical protein